MFELYYSKKTGRKKVPVKDQVQRMKAVRIFNNNAVSTVTPDGREAVVIGSGVGFNKRPGDAIDEGKIEKIYCIQDELQTRLLQLLKDTSPEILRVSEDILNHAIDCGLELKNQLIISLADHISFAIDRYKKGVELPYLMLSETRMLYKKEYEIGCWALDHIKEVCGVSLPEYETGYIALQLASSSMNGNVAYKTLKLVEGALKIIKEVYGVELDPDHIDTMRLITHLKFLAQRIFSQMQWEDKEVDGLYQFLVAKHKKNRECLIRLRAYIEKTFSYTLNSQEEVYLLVHLSKIFYK